MKIGDMIHATWTDGLTAVGRYSEKKQGFIILLDEKNKVIVCNPHHVRFEIIQEKDKKISDNRAKDE